MPAIRVREVVEETADARTLVLEPVEGADLSYRPGQFLTLRIPSERPGGAARCYSLCSTPGYDAYPAVTVKRTRDGYASNWLCDNIVPGAELEALRPSGVFTPESFDDDLLLLAGGSGITPVMSILKSVLRFGSGSVRLVYANRDEKSVIFAERLVALCAEFPERLTVVHWLESVQGVPSAAGLQALVAGATDRACYICGPVAFMDLAEQVLLGLGVPGHDVHLERFTSLQGDPFADFEVQVDASAATTQVEVTLDGATKTLAWPESNKLLDVLLAAGLDAPFSCREGACSACACILLEGEVDLEHNEVLDAKDLEDGLILGCQARPKTPIVRVSYDE